MLFVTTCSHRSFVFLPMWRYIARNSRCMLPVLESVGLVFSGESEFPLCILLGLGISQV